jgi:hypothetical protein
MKRDATRFNLITTGEAICSICPELTWKSEGESGCIAILQILLLTFDGIKYPMRISFKTPEITGGYLKC